MSYPDFHAGVGCGDEFGRRGGFRLALGSMTARTGPSRLSDPVVGIDLGTTNSVLAYCDERGPRVLHGADEKPILPSVVRYGADGSVEAVGEAAKA
ncbi:MAG: Hsp70 family protein, partial [Planctomycetota bacterium]|nr:Hsp70 family protein [Planctomycetota bacterium]